MRISKFFVAFHSVLMIPLIGRITFARVSFKLARILQCFLYAKSFVVLLLHFALKGSAIGVSVTRFKKDENYIFSI